MHRTGNRMWLAVALAGTMAFAAAACTSRAGEASSPRTTTTTTATTTTTTTTPPAAEPDLAIAAQAAEILASGDVAGFNARICTDVTDIAVLSPIAPIASIGGEYAAIRPVEISPHTLTGGDALVATLNMSQGIDLVVIVPLTATANDWCVLDVNWCPYDFPGLAPFPVVPGEYPGIEAVERQILCPGGP